MPSTMLLSLISALINLYSVNASKISDDDDDVVQQSSVSALNPPLSPSSDVNSALKKECQELEEILCSLQKLNSKKHEIQNDMLTIRRELMQQGLSEEEIDKMYPQMKIIFDQDSDDVDDEVQSRSALKKTKKKADIKPKSALKLKNLNSRSVGTQKDAPMTSGRSDTSMENIIRGTKAGMVKLRSTSTMTDKPKDNNNSENFDSDTEHDTDSSSSDGFEVIGEPSSESDVLKTKVKSRAEREKERELEKQKQEAKKAHELAKKSGRGGSSMKGKDQEMTTGRSKSTIH